MVKITSVNRSARLRKSILDAARRKLVSWDRGKTTMQEIANELSVSKATLYYYFPGREALLMEVAALEKEKYFRSVELRMHNILDPAEKLSDYVRLRIEIGQDICFKEVSGMTGASKHRSKVPATRLHFRDREKRIVSDIIEKGIRSGAFRDHDTMEHAGIFLDVLDGLLLAGDTNNIDKHETAGKQLLFTRIFVNAIKKQDL